MSLDLIEYLIEHPPAGGSNLAELTVD